MVSPFMSFATGALNAVGNQLDTYQKNKATIAAEERQLASDMQKLKFERETREGVAQISADATRDAARMRNAATNENKYFTVAGIKIPKGSTRAAEVTNFFSAIAEHGDQFEKAMQDATLAPEVKRALLKYSLDARSDKAFYSTSIAGVTAPRPPLVSAYFANSFRNTPLIRAQIMNMEDGGYMEKPSNVPPDAVSQSRLPNGERAFGVVTPEVSNAINVVNSITLGGIGRDQAQQVAKLKDLVGGFYNKDAGKWKGYNKYYSAATSPFVKLITSDSMIADESEKQAAMQWLRDPKHGFVDPKGKIKDDFFKLVSIYARGDEGVREQGYRDQPVTFSQLMAKNDNIKKEFTSIQESSRIATAGLNTTKKLKDAINRAGTGSGIGLGLLQLTTQIPNLANEARIIISEALSQTQFQLGSKTRSRFENSIKKYTSATNSGNKESIAAAEAEMLENMLAYQLTSVLQGGNGGRTISDQDVERSIKMLGGRYDTKEQRLAKLDYVEDLLNQQVRKTKLYSTLTPQSNAAKYNSIRKAASFLDEYTLQNFDTVFKAKMEERGVPTDKSSLGDVSDSSTSLARSLGNFPNIAYKENPNQISEKINGFLRGAKGRITQDKKSDNVYVVNADAGDTWRRAVAEGANLSAIRERVMKLAPTAYNATTGEIVKIIYTDDGNFDIEASAATENTPPPQTAAELRILQGRTPPRTPPSEKATPGAKLFRRPASSQVPQVPQALRRGRPGHFPSQ